MRTVRENVDLVLYPINTNWGFSIGFSVTQIQASFPGAEDWVVKLLFLKKQLPKAYGWEDLAKVFNSRENIERTQVSGLAKRLSGFTSNGFGEEGDYDY
ncbi:MAG: hypothetical protein AABX10_03530 [Nanoarchaeota archaeon]